MGVGERSPFVTEELRLEEIAGKRRAVHRHEGSFAPRTALVDPARQELLTGAGLSGDEHRRILVGQNERRPRQRCLERFALADELGEGFRIAARRAPQGCLPPLDRDRCRVA